MRFYHLLLRDPDPKSSRVIFCMNSGTSRVTSELVNKPEPSFLDLARILIIEIHDSRRILWILTPKIRRSYVPCQNEGK